MEDIGLVTAFRGPDITESKTILHSLSMAIKKEGNAEEIMWYNC